MNIWAFLQRLNWNYQTIAAVVSIAAYLTIILLVVTKARKHPAMKWFVLANTAVIFWIGGFCVLSMVKDYTRALHFSRFFELGAIFTSPLYMTLSFSVMKVSHNRNVVRGYYLGAIVLAIFNFCGPYFIKGIIAQKYSFALWYLLPGPLYYVFPVFFGVGVAYLCYRVYVQQKIEPQKRKQAFLLIAGVMLASAGGLFYFLTIFFNVPVHFPHDYLTILLPVATMYNIIRYRLMEIDTVIHRTILWALMSMGLIIPIYFVVITLRAWLTRLSDLWLAMVEMFLFYVFLGYYHYFQPKIDHLFRRRKYDYYQVLSEIGQKVGSELDIINISTRLFKEMRDILYIRNAFLLLQETTAGDYQEIARTGYGKEEEAKREKLVLSPNEKIMSWFHGHKTAIERERVSEDPEYQEIRDDFLDFMKKEQAEVLIPIITEDRVNGLLGIGKKENLNIYTARDLELLEKMGKQIGVTIENALHHEDIVEKERMAEELKLGREIQTALLPKISPSVAGLNVAGEMIPAKEIGGDYFDYLNVKDEKLGIVIGDVSGKGVAAGLLMSMAKTAIHTLSQQGTSPREILLYTNQILFNHIGGQKFMTMLYLFWDGERRKMIYSSAGHEHIVIYRKQMTDDRAQMTDKDQTGTRQALDARVTTHNVVEVILSGGFMLGMVPEIGEFLEEKEIALTPGDKIVLYTDGVTEARNEREDMFRLENLVATVKKHGAKPAEELKKAIHEELYAFIGKQEQYDDITLVVLEAT